MSDKNLVDMVALCRAFHLRDRQMRSLITNGIVPGPIEKRGQKPYYDYWACHHAFIDYLNGKGTQSTIARKQEEHLEKKNRKLDMELAEREGKLVDANIVKRELVELFTMIKTRIRAIPVKSAQEISHIKKAKKGKELVTDIQKVLEIECNECLTELSNWEAE